MEEQIGPELPRLARVAKALGCTPYWVTYSTGWGEWRCGCRHGAGGRHNYDEDSARDGSLRDYEQDWSALGPWITELRITIRPTIQGILPRDDPMLLESWDAFIDAMWVRGGRPEAFAVGKDPLDAVCNLILELAAAGKLPLQSASLPAGEPEDAPAS